MKINYIVLVIAALLTMSSCKKDFLKRDTGVVTAKKDVFEDAKLAAQFADRSFAFTIIDYYGLGSVGQPHRGTISEFTDEAVSGNLDEVFKAVYSGDWTNGSHATEFTSIISGSRALPPYVRFYQGIRNVNVFLEQYSSIPWKNEPSLNGELVKAQQLYFRAYFYFELARRWGGAIIMDKPLQLTDNLDIPRSTFEATLAFIEKDINEAELIFSNTTFLDNTGASPALVYTPQMGWNPNYSMTIPGSDVSNNNGRPDLGAVRALRSRALLLAASPLWNPSGDASKWQKAADAAKLVIDMGRYNLHSDYSKILTDPISHEYILAYIRGPRISNVSGFFRDYLISPSTNGYLEKSGSLNPTQNHVDLYETKQGYRIADTGSGYTLASPYNNRDPRLEFNVIHNDQTWQAPLKMETWYTPIANGITYGKDVSGTVGTGTATSYYCRKLWPEALKGNTTSTALLNFVYYRYGEILLNYAEALNEAQGPVAGVAVAVNQIRQRPTVNMPTVAQTFSARGIALSKDNMRDLIRNERAVELAFENVRWFDILRWKKGREIVGQPIKRMDVRKLGTTFFYAPTVMSNDYQRRFDDFMHLYPIPLNEIAKGNNLLQNPGWPN
ncbi:RagB/SusD family nutrient uptake outer membrane protein [Daejeonella sp.]|uniref:RagB/SusD family nutrient uptake outer membrane protein n=1 Tax=Daejeonella sp. TaxID=2805397 RepID=UPI0030C03B1F